MGYANMVFRSLIKGGQTLTFILLGEAGIGEHLGYTVITVSSSRALILHRDATGGAVSGLTFENNERVFGTISVNNDNKPRFIDGDGNRFIINTTPE